MAPGRPSLSAATVGLCRAHLHSLGVIDDPYVVDLLPPKVPWRVAEAALRVPVLRRFGRNPSFAYLAGRTLFFDDVVGQATENGVGQVVILGAGYDARAWRLKRPGVTFFEVDLPATQADKKSRARRDGPAYVAADVTDPNLPSLLREAGYNSERPGVFTLEGLTMYLSEDGVRRLLQVLSDLGADGSRLAANFGVGFERQGSDRGRIGRRLLSFRGEPLRFRLPVDAAGSFLAECGWSMEHVLTGSQLASRYLQGTPLQNVKVRTSGFAVDAALAPRPNAASAQRRS